MATWQYKIKPAMKIYSLVHDGKIFYSTKWTVSSTRLTDTWYKEYLHEQEVSEVAPAVSEATVVKTTRRKSS